MTPVQAAFFHKALDFLGKPYKWGGQDESEVDCSGLVIECIRAIPGFGEVPDLNAEGIRRDYCRPYVSKAGSFIRLGFLIPSGKEATHVVVFLPDSSAYVHSSGTAGKVSIETSEENYNSVSELDWNTLIRFCGPSAARQGGSSIHQAFPPGGLKG